MKKTIITCDICGKDDAREVSFYVGRFPDPAGASEDHHERIDLCSEHVLYAFRVTQGLLSGGAGRNAFDKMKALTRTS